MLYINLATVMNVFLMWPVSKACTFVIFLDCCITSNCLIFSTEQFVIEILRTVLTCAKNLYQVH